MTQADRFPNQTAWTVILEAQDPASPERRARLERLATLYWKPVRNHLRMQWNLDGDAAADLTQEFFLRFLQDDFLKGAAPERGRFRTFLKMKLRDLVIDDLRKRTALKRGGAAKFVAIGSERRTHPLRSARIREARGENAAGEGRRGSGAREIGSGTRSDGAPIPRRRAGLPEGSLCRSRRHAGRVCAEE
jgi:hypothetical protein